MKLILFSLLAGLTIVPAFFVVTMKNVFHAALCLILTLIGVAGFYAMLAADFIFVVQLLVYAGGITVILLFVVLLSGSPADWAQAAVNEKAWGAALFSAFLVMGLVYSLFSWPMKTTETLPATTTGQLGDLLMGRMVLPFEVISLVLVAALVGAIHFSRKNL